MGFHNVPIFVLFLTLAISALAALPNVSSYYGAKIDPYSSYQSQNTCLGVVQNGTARLAAFWKQANPGIGSGIGLLRDCAAGDNSEHKEGRAMDYMLDSTNKTQAAVAQQVIDWLLATDAYGNQNAMVRRTGLMYMIWVDRIWGA
jgi:hypothetical protein